MKSGIRIGLAIAFFASVGIVMLWHSIRVPNEDEPQRLPNVPQDAIWKGGVDKGFWYVITDIDTLNRTARFNIFADYNGELVIDASYKESARCQIDPFTKKHLLQSIFDFGFNNIEMLDNKCSLEMIEPAYGGSFPESDEEQQEFYKLKGISSMQYSRKLLYCQRHLLQLLLIAISPAFEKKGCR